MISTALLIVLLLSKIFHFFYDKYASKRLEHIFDFFNLRFMFPHLLGVQNAEIALPGVPIVLSSGRTGSRCHLDKLVSCCYALCRRILKINPYPNLSAWENSCVPTEAVEDLHINSTVTSPLRPPLTSLIQKYRNFLDAHSRTAQYVVCRYLKFPLPHLENITACRSCFAADNAH